MTALEHGSVVDYNPGSTSKNSGDYMRVGSQPQQLNLFLYGTVVNTKPNQYHQIHLTNWYLLSPWRKPHNIFLSDASISCSYPPLSLFHSQHFPYLLRNTYPKRITIALQNALSTPHRPPLPPPYNFPRHLHINPLPRPHTLRHHLPRPRLPPLRCTIQSSPRPWHQETVRARSRLVPTVQKRKME
jgi:hypothetical protein